MKLCCPHFDRSLTKLIDAYNHVDDSKIFRMPAGIHVRDDVQAIYLAMAEHRKVCPLCHLEGLSRPIGKVTSREANGTRDHR